LLPTFARKRLDQITVQDVDRYRAAKVAEGRLNATSINKCLTVLAAVLEQAREYGHIERNPAAGKRRKLPANKPKRTSLDSAQAITALLDAAGELDAERTQTRPFLRALLSTLVFSGMRIGECLALRWRDVDLAGARIRVPGTKTEAAERYVQMAPALRDELGARAARRRDENRGAYVWPTRTGKPLLRSNVLKRVCVPAVERANERLAEQGRDPLPHSRRTASDARTRA
jgi:integrase